MTNNKGIRVQVYETDSLEWWFDLYPEAVACRQYRVSQEEWDRLAQFEKAHKDIQELLGIIARREEVEFEEAWEDEQQRQRDIAPGGQAKITECADCPKVDYLATRKHAWMCCTAMDSRECPPTGTPAWCPLRVLGQEKKMEG